MWAPSWAHIILGARTTISFKLKSLMLINWSYTTPPTYYGDYST